VNSIEHYPLILQEEEDTFSAAADTLIFFCLPDFHAEKATEGWNPELNKFCSISVKFLVFSLTSSF
jgi:hypothetical protein